MEPQQKHAPVVGTLGDDGEPPANRILLLLLLWFKHTTPVTSDEPFLLLLHEPDMVVPVVFLVL